MLFYYTQNLAKNTRNVPKHFSILHVYLGTVKFELLNIVSGKFYSWESIMLMTRATGVPPTTPPPQPAPDNPHRQHLHKTPIYPTRRSHLLRAVDNTIHHRSNRIRSSEITRGFYLSSTLKFRVSCVPIHVIRAFSEFTQGT